MKTYIKAELNGNVIELSNIKVIKGHDDSLPFTADVYFNGKQIGTASNDGWGGEPDVDVNTEGVPDWTDFIGELTDKTWAIVDNGDEKKDIKYSLCFLVDVLAYRAIALDQVEYDWNPF